MLALAHLRCSLAILGGRREAIEPLIETIESITGDDHISARFLRAQAHSSSEHSRMPIVSSKDSPRNIPDIQGHEPSSSAASNT